MKLALVLVLAACFDKPRFSGRDAAVGGDDAPIDMATDIAIDTPIACTPSKPSAPGMIVDTNPANTTVTMLDGSSIGFRNVLNRYPFPDRLVVAGQNLVATPEGCQFEDQVGVSAYPVYSVGAQPVTAGNITHVLDVLVQGAAYTLLETHWTIPIPSVCGSSQTMGAGNTTWAFFPDGKVVRNDVITPTVSSAITASPTCNCMGATGATNFLVTSYTTFEASRLSAVTRAGDAEQQTLPGSIQNARGACARGMAGGKVAVYWDRLDGNDPAPTPTRLRRDTNFSTNHEIFAFVYDMVTFVNMASTMTAGMSYGIRTHMLLHSGTSPCTELLTEVESFAAAQQLMITPSGGTPLPVDYGRDGFFDDMTAHAGPVTIRGAAPAGFAVRLRFTGYTAVSTDRAADRVVWQREMDGSFTVFFVDGLGPTTPITVTPECPV